MSRGTLIFLLQHLGFVINLKKSVLKPSQQIEFLGLEIDTHSMTSALTEEKKEKVILKRQNLLSHPQTTVLELTQLIGLMSSTVQADLPARLQIRYLQQQQIESLHQAISYQAEIVLNSLSKTGTPLVGGKIKIKQWKITKAKGTKFSDTNRCIKIRLGSLLQWGVNWGTWSEKKENLHANVLELIAAKFVILTFTKGQSNIAIHLQIDNKTALLYLLKMGEGRGYTQQRTLAHQQVHLELPSQQTNRNVCGVPSPCSKCTCRLGITKCQ